MPATTPGSTWLRPGPRRWCWPRPYWPILPPYPAACAAHLDTSQQRLTAGFAAWLQVHYNTLHSLPYLPAPILGHQVAHFLAHRLRQDSQRQPAGADCVRWVGLDQWQVLRDAWQDQGRTWQFDEQALFSVLPTITPIARQAIFAGELPLYFPDTWQRTDVDGRRWQRFWEDQGLLASAAVWLLGTDHLDWTLADSRVRRARAGDHECRRDGARHDRRPWRVTRPRSSVGRTRMPGQVVERLLAAGFDVWLTSDHGNVEAKGIGRPREGVLVEQRGSRVRFYTDATFLQHAHKVRWPIRCPGYQAACRPDC